MVETIELYNHFHNGDIFYSRMLTQSLSEHFKIIYYHNQSKLLFKDVENIKEVFEVPNYMSKYESMNDKKIINTWIGQNGSKYLLGNELGCCFSNYIKLVNDVLTSFNIEIKNNVEYLPTIKFENLKNYDSILKEIEILKKIFKKIILVSNGKVNSGQSQNFDMSNILIKLSNFNKDCLFLVTENFENNYENIINVSSLTKLNDDLLEIGFISKYCDVIIGRASGPYCFTHTKENLLNTKKTFISICNNNNEGIWFSESKAKQVWTNNYDFENIFNIINYEIS